MVFISFLILISMIFSPLAKTLFHVDEFFTLGLIKYSIRNAITLTSYDVHPPLYYIILKIVTKVLNLLNINLNTIFILKIVTIIPGFLLTLIFLYKINILLNFF